MRQLRPQRRRTRRCLLFARRRSAGSRPRRSLREVHLGELFLFVGEPPFHSFDTESNRKTRTCLFFLGVSLAIDTHVGLGLGPVGNGMFPRATVSLDEDMWKAVPWCLG